MPRWLILAATHIAAAAAGFAGGIYMLPILTAPVSPTEAVLRSSTPEALYSGRLVRDLAGSDLLHWGEGEVRVLPLRIAHIGRLSPGPDYKLYLTPHFVDTEVSDVPAPPLRERSERRCLKPLRASTHDDFKAYA